MTTAIDANTLATLRLTPEMRNEFSTIQDSVKEALELGVKRLNVHTAPGSSSVSDLVIHAAARTDRFVTFFSVDFCTADDLMRGVEYHSKAENNIILITNYDKATLNGQYSIEEAQEIIELFIKAVDATLTIVTLEDK